MRYYSSRLGRWSQLDPKEQPTDPVQSDRYSYAGNDPVNRVDPTGTCFIVSCDTYNRVGDFTAGTLAAAGSTLVGGASIVATAACVDATEGLATLECGKIGAIGLNVAAGGYYTSYRLYSRAFSSNP